MSICDATRGNLAHSDYVYTNPDRSENGAKE